MNTDAHNLSLAGTERDGRPGAANFVLYIDETGTHDMVNVNPEQPIFGLAGCILSRAQYDALDSRIARFKIEHCGTADVCLHGNAIRTRKNAFYFLRDSEKAAAFFDELNDIMATAQFTVIAGIIRKDQLPGTELHGGDPYHIALGFLLERFHHFLHSNSAEGAVVLELRGKAEDGSLRRAYASKLATGFGEVSATEMQRRLPYPPEFRGKTPPCTGLEIADLVAHPLARHIHQPDLANRAYEIALPKCYDGNCGSVEQYGLKVFP